MKSKVSQKGQVTIPKRLRRSLGIRAGTTLTFEERAGRLVATPMLPGDPFARMVGVLPRMDVDAALAGMRGPAPKAGRKGR